MPRVKAQKRKPQHAPLGVDLDNDTKLQQYGVVTKPGKRAHKSREEEEEDHIEVMDEKSSRAIMALALEQQEEEKSGEEEATDVPSKQPRTVRIAEHEESDSEEDNEWNDNDYDAELEIDEQDRRTLDAFLHPSDQPKRTLADAIFEKLEAASAVRKGDTAGVPSAVAQSNLPPEMVPIFEKTALYLKNYRSGPLPKVVSFLPQSPHWAQLLAMTRPHEWSRQAMYRVMRVLAANLKPKQLQIFLESVVLETVREDISDNGKMHPLYRRTLEKSMFKPAAFFQGFLLPLLNSNCTLKEASIVAAILTLKRIPNLHCAAALSIISESDYSGPHSLFIRVLLNKKHALPYKTLDDLFNHFVRLANTYKPANKGEPSKLPVMWHQSLLVYCQRYANDLTQDQKNALLDVVRVIGHPQIGPEVRRELISSVARGEPRPPEQDEAMQL